MWFQQSSTVETFFTGHASGGQTASFCMPEVSVLPPTTESSYLTTEQRCVETTQMEPAREETAVNICM